MSYITTASEPEPRKNLWHRIVLYWSMVVVTIMTGAPVFVALVDWRFPSIGWIAHVAFGMVLLLALYHMLTDDAEIDTPRGDLITILLWIGFAYQVYFLIHETFTYSPHSHSWAPPIIFVGVVYGWMPFIFYDAINRVLGRDVPWLGLFWTGFGLSFDKLAKRLDRDDGGGFDQGATEERRSEAVVVSFDAFKQARDAQDDRDNT